MPSSPNGLHLQPVQLATRISPRVRKQLDDTVDAIKARGEQMSTRQALEEAIDTWCEHAQQRYDL